MRTFLTLFALAFSAAAFADDAKPNRIERGAQKVEKGVKNTAQRTGDAIERGAKATERGVTRTVDKTKKGVERTVERTEKKVKKLLE
jgi:hypothetical protein